MSYNYGHAQYPGKQVNRKREHAKAGIVLFIFLASLGIAGHFERQDIAETERVVIIGNEPISRADTYNCHACHVPNWRNGGE